MTTCTLSRGKQEAGIEVQGLHIMSEEQGVETPLPNLSIA